MTPPKCSADITSVSNEDGGEVGGVVQTSLMGMLMRERHAAAFGIWHAAAFEVRHATKHGEFERQAVLNQNPRSLGLTSTSNPFETGGALTCNRAPEDHRLFGSCHTKEEEDG